jgi:general stress protein 26
MKRLNIAACGIDCNECGQYKVTAERDIKAAESLVEWFKSRGWIGENEGAEAVMKKSPLCKGCWNFTDDCFFKEGCGSCNIRVCCKEKQINHCGECIDFPCDDYMEYVGNAEHHKKAMEYLLSLRKAKTIVNGSTIHTVGESGLGADWVMSLTDEEGYPAASMITASRADGFKWIAFCTGLNWNKFNRAEKDPRSCIYLFDKESFSGISLTGKIEIITDLEVKKQMWYDALGDFWNGCDDERWCVLMFKPERYNIFIDNRTIRGAF